MKNFKAFHFISRILATLVVLFIGITSAHAETLKIAAGAGCALLVRIDGTLCESGKASLPASLAPELLRMEVSHV